MSKVLENYKMLIRIAARERLSLRKDIIESSSSESLIIHKPNFLNPDAFMDRVEDAIRYISNNKLNDLEDGKFNITTYKNDNNVATLEIILG